MSEPLRADDFLFITVEEASDPPMGLVMVIKNYWWPVDEEGRIAFYNPWLKNRSRGRRFHGYGSPQCNANRIIAERVAKNYGWATECIQIPAVFVKEDSRDWADH